MVPIVIKKSNCPCGHFFKFQIFYVRFGISVLRHIEMGGVAIALPKKMVITSRPTVATALGIKLKPVNIRSCFASIICHSEAQMVSIRSQYMSQSTLFFQNFTLLFLAAGTNLAKKWHFATANFSTLPARKMLKLIFKSYICDYWAPWHKKNVRGAEIKRRC